MASELIHVGYWIVS